MISNKYQCSTLFSISMLSNCSCIQQLAVIPACWPEFLYIAPAMLVLEYTAYLGLYIASACDHPMLTITERSSNTWISLSMSCFGCTLYASTSDTQQGTACDYSITTWRQFWNIWNHMLWGGSWNPNASVQVLSTLLQASTNCLHCTSHMQGTSINRQDSSYKSERHSWNVQHAAGISYE